MIKILSYAVNKNYRDQSYSARKIMLLVIWYTNHEPGTVKHAILVYSLVPMPALWGQWYN